nr:virulence factor TspB C-terminal domain-related protein [Acidovorax sp. BoFeN1]
MPDLVPLELPPGTPLPVEPPVINPAPGPNPQPRPLFIPTGNPVPNPNYDPQQPPGPANQPYFQPGVRVVPSPSANEPWRVDLQPVNRPVSGPEPMTQPDSETPPDADKPSQEQLDFCVKNPDVLACQKLDEPEAQELPESEKDISISPDGGWGADNAACPAPKLITVQGRAIPIPFDLFCTWASGMRPIIIAMAWLSAAFILLGARNES